MMLDKFSQLTVIIPTFNRKESLLRTLYSLSQQTYSGNLFKVIVVDDGGNDGSEIITEQNYPFQLWYVKQQNSGAVNARNRAVQISQSPYLLFTDDDIFFTPECLKHFVDQLQVKPFTIIVGNLITAKSDSISSAFHTLHTQIIPQNRTGQENDEISFTECLSGFMAIRREDYFTIGLMEKLTDTDGANSWCDVDFGYRAYRKGYKFYQASQAIGYHYDHTIYNFERFCQQQAKVGRLGVLLFQKHPQLREYVTMLTDKEPIRWRKDPLSLTINKLFHAFSARTPILQAMQMGIKVFERRFPNSKALAVLFRWVSSAYLYQGYQQGLIDFSKQ